MIALRLASWQLITEQVSHVQHIYIPHRIKLLDPQYHLPSPLSSVTSREETHEKKQAPHQPHGRIQLVNVYRCNVV